MCRIRSARRRRVGSGKPGYFLKGSIFLNGYFFFFWEGVFLVLGIIIVIVDFVDFDLIFNLFPFLDIFWNYFAASKN